MHDPKRSITLREGALIGPPARPDQARRVWMIAGTLRKAARPQPDLFSLYSPDFFLEDPCPWSVPEDPECVTALPARDLLPQITPLTGRSCLSEALDWETPSVAMFEDSFRDLQTRFETGDLTKAVPVFFERAAFSASSLPMACWISALLRAPETLMPYGRWSAQGGILGASPELLFEIHNGVLRTMALAGTRPVPETTDAAGLTAAKQAFLANPKERKEHTLVIDGIRDSLSSFGKVHVGETKILALPSLWHLQTRIEVRLTHAPSFEALVRALHPTPALGGTPRDASFQWLRQQEDARRDAGRGMFGAPFGALLPNGDAFCLVAIRNVMWDTDTIRIGAGGGVLPESQMEREWEELRQKRNSVKRLFGL